MPPRLVLVHDQDPPEAPAVTREPEPEPNVFPGANRRDWVYREISQRGPDPAPPVERA